MSSALVKQTTIVQVSRLNKTRGYRIPSLEFFPCLHINKNLRVVQDPQTDEAGICSVVHWGGYAVPFSFTGLPQKAIAFCDLCIKHVPEFSQDGFTFTSLSKPRVKEIKEILEKIRDFVDEKFPCNDDDDEC